jgi:hypothetical protein
MEYRIVNESPGYYCIQQKKTVFFFFTKWEYVMSKTAPTRLCYETRRGAQSFINFQNNPKLKK